VPKQAAKKGKRGGNCPLVPRKKKAGTITAGYTYNRRPFFQKVQKTKNGKAEFLHRRRVTATSQTELRGANKIGGGERKKLKGRRWGKANRKNQCWHPRGEGEMKGKNFNGVIKMRTGSKKPTVMRKRKEESRPLQTRGKDVGRGGSI